MTAKKGRRRTIEEIDFDSTSSEQDFESWLDDIGESASSVDIYRMVRTEREQLDKVPFDEIKGDVYAYLRERFGVGKYWLKFKSADKLYQGSKTLLIGSQSKAEVLPPAGQPAGLGNHADLYREQITMQQTLLTAMVAAFKPAPPMDLGGMMTGLGAILAAVSGNKSDPVAMFTAVTAAVTGLAGPQKDEDWLERFEKMATVMKTIMPDKGDSWLGVIRDVGKEVVNKLQLPAIGATTATAVPQEVKADMPQNKPAPAAERSYAEWVRYGLGILKEKARAGKDAGFYVDLMFEESEQRQWNAILGAIQHGATFENLLQFDPEISQDPTLTSWFKLVFDGVSANIQEHVDSSGEGGNAGNAAKDGGSGSAGSATS